MDYVIAQLCCGGNGKIHLTNPHHNSLPFRESGRDPLRPRLLSRRNITMMYVNVTSLIGRAKILDIVLQP
jgi:hypothetical protein